MPNESELRLAPEGAEQSVIGSEELTFLALGQRDVHAVVEAGIRLEGKIHCRMDELRYPVGHGLSPKEIVEAAFRLSWTR